MTYKGMMQGVVGRSAMSWVETFITEESKAKYVSVVWDDVTLNMDKSICYYKTKVSLYGRHKRKPETYVTVGGCADADGCLHNGVIYDWNGKVIWMSTKSGRDVLGITKPFEL